MCLWLSLAIGATLPVVLVAGVVSVKCLFRSLSSQLVCPLSTSWFSAQLPHRTWVIWLEPRLQWAADDVFPEYLLSNRTYHLLLTLCLVYNVSAFASLYIFFIKQKDLQRFFLNFFF